MTKREMARVIAERTGMKPRQVEKVLTEFATIAVDSLTEGEDVRVAGLGCFSPRHRPAVERKNNLTGRKHHWPSRTTVTFRPYDSTLTKMNEGN